MNTCENCKYRLLEEAKDAYKESMFVCNNLKSIQYRHFIYLNNKCNKHERVTESTIKESE